MDDLIVIENLLDLDWDDFTDGEVLDIVSEYIEARKEWKTITEAWDILNDRYSSIDFLLFKTKDAVWHKEMPTWVQEHR